MRERARQAVDEYCGKESFALMSNCHAIGILRAINPNNRQQCNGVESLNCTITRPLLDLTNIAAGLPLLNLLISSQATYTSKVSVHIMHIHIHENLSML